MVASQHLAGQFIEQVVLLIQEFTGGQHCHALAAIFIAHLAQPAGSKIESCVPIHLYQFSTLCRTITMPIRALPALQQVLAHPRVGLAVRMVDKFVSVATFQTQVQPIHRRSRCFCIGSNPHHASARYIFFNIQLQLAAHSTISAGRTQYAVGNAGADRHLIV